VAMMAKGRPSNKLMIVGALVFVGWLTLPDRFGISYAADNAKKTYHLVILGDPHLPGKYAAEKEAVIETINSWEDVDMAVAVGDLLFELGTADELAYAKKFFGHLKKPLYVIAGNHDYLYEDSFDSRGIKKKGSSGNRKQKLKRFRETFGLPDLYYSKPLGRYLLLFLSTDNLTSSDLTRISGVQIDWLRAELTRNKTLPTILFFHAPLKGTLRNYKLNANRPNYVAQPEEKIRELLVQNPQVFLWVSGHTHTPATNESYASDINLYEKRVNNIHNCDLNRGTIWTNSIYLSSDKVVVKTFDHKRRVWMDHLQRTLRPFPGPAPPPH
jgi:Icc protein